MEHLLKKFGFKKSNFKDYYETDPESFELKLKQEEEVIKRLNLTPRKCGDCNLCCKLTPVPALKKNEHEWCNNCEIGVGCKIYKERPLDCQAFNCLWALGIINEEYKPNKVGFFMTLNSMNDAMLGMLKVYTEKHKLDSTIKKLKNFKSSRNAKIKGFHIRYGAEKKDTCFLHLDHGENGEYGLKYWEELEKEVNEVLDKLPFDLKEKFLEYAKKSW